MYNSKDYYFYEIIQDYKNTADQNEKEQMLQEFFKAVWSSPNKRRIYKKTIRFAVTSNLSETAVGKVFNIWSAVEYTGYKHACINADYISLLRQKINNIYTRLFDSRVILNKEYMKLINTPKTLYYRWLAGEEFDAAMVTGLIDDAIHEALKVKSKYQQQKMKLSWKNYRTIVENCLRKIFETCRMLDDYEDGTLPPINTDYWNEDNFYIRYFCRSLDGHFRKYQKKYYHIRDHKNYRRCLRCGSLFELENRSHRYCPGCRGSYYQQKDAKAVTCTDCGKMFEVPPRNNKTIRCRDCQTQLNQKNTRRRVQKHRAQSL